MRRPVVVDVSWLEEIYPIVPRPLVVDVSEVANPVRVDVREAVET